MRILLAGKTGQVGHYLVDTLAPLGEVVAPDRRQMDFTRADSLRNAVRAARPEVIINAAGATIVDQAEREPEVTMQVNAVASTVIAEEARRLGALLVHYSTTFVFDGTKRTPYVEDDILNPINVYGRSKLAGEQAVAASGAEHIILRASWTYSDRRANFPLAFLKLARERKQLDVVADQVASPTWARAYADATADLLKQVDRARSNAGTYHLSAAGDTTRFGWATKMIELARPYLPANTQWAELRPIASSVYPHTAERPVYTVIDNSKIAETFGIRMSRWETQLEGFVHDWAARQRDTVQ